MDKIYVEDARKFAAKIWKSGNDSIVYQLISGMFVKEFSEDYVKSSRELGVDLEGKVNASEEVEMSKGIVKPLFSGYARNGMFRGYGTEECLGCSYNDVLERLRGNGSLADYATLYHKVEKEVMANENLVFPDICNRDNIMLDESGKVRLIDYDGMQVEDYKSRVRTNVLRGCEEMEKYYQDGLWSKLLDRRSMIWLYFWSVFEIDLNRLGRTENWEAALQRMFRYIQLDDEEVMDNVYRMLCPNKEEDYLQDSVFRLADTYNLQASKNGARRLVRK